MTRGRRRGRYVRVRVRGPVASGRRATSSVAVFAAIAVAASMFVVGASYSRALGARRGTRRPPTRPPHGCMRITLGSSYSFRIVALRTPSAVAAPC